MQDATIIYPSTSRLFPNQDPNFIEHTGFLSNPPCRRKSHCQIAKSRFSQRSALFINVVQTNTLAERCLANADCHPPNNVCTLSMMLNFAIYIEFFDIVLVRASRTLPKRNAVLASTCQNSSHILVDS